MERRRCKKTTPSLHYTGLLDNPFSNLELRNLTLTWKRGEASRWRALLSPKSSERLVRHARARIPNDVRAREGDYFVGSRAPQTQGRKGAQGSNEKKLNDISGESRQEPTHISALLFWVAQRGLKSSLRISPVCVQFPESLRPHPPSQDRKLRERKERETGQRETYTTHRVQWGEETVRETPALHYTGLLDNPFSNSELRTSLRQE